MWLNYAAYEVINIKELLIYSVDGLGTFSCTIWWLFWIKGWTVNITLLDLNYILYRFEVIWHSSSSNVFILFSIPEARIICTILDVMAPTSKGIYIYKSKFVYINVLMRTAKSRCTFTNMIFLYLNGCSWMIFNLGFT